MTASRIAPLDALRGLAALAVAIFHYGHMAPAGARPLEAALGGVYQFGLMSVPLFYMLSGYIFFVAYGRALGERRLQGADFFWLRASRLYPLHLLTLFVVIVLQALTWRATGAFYAYPHNDLVHFLLNLGFLQFGWWDDVLSFNGPTWSLSIEAGVYVVFFFFARAFGESVKARLAMAGVCLALSAARAHLPDSGLLNWRFAQGLGCFFLGGCLQLTQGWPDRLRLVVGVVSMEAGLGLIYATQGRLESTLCLGLLFGGLILASLGSRALAGAAASAPLAGLGDVSYSVYLWHFPVQLVMRLAVAAGLTLDFGTPTALALYLAATLGVSTLSYRGFELPARKAVRRWAASRAPAPKMA